MTFSSFLILLTRKIKTVSFLALLSLIVVHAVPAYFAYWYLGEEKLVSSVITFAYYYVVTSSSIGYGDISPSTELGRLFTIVYLIPISFSLFATLAAKMVGIMVQEITKIQAGFGDFSNWKNHLLIVGYVPKATDRMIRELEKDFPVTPIVVVTASEHRPSNRDVMLVRAENLASISDLRRAGIKGARSIVVMGVDDGETLLAALAVSSMVDGDRHVVAHFESSETANILEANCQNIETVSNNSVEQVSRALADPGASHVIADLVSTSDPTSLRSTVWTGANTTVREMMLLLLGHEATLVGYGDKIGANIVLRGSDTIETNKTVYYIGSCDILL